MGKVASLCSASVLALALSACSGFVNGHDSVVRVTTAPGARAHCVVENAKGAWAVYATPAYVSVHRSSDPLVIECRTTDNRVGRAVLTPRVDARAVATDVVVGAARGGVMAASPLSWISDYAVVGAVVAASGAAAVDGDDGALYEYAPTVAVTLSRDPAVGA
jgi:hypothetical protein